MERLPPGGAVLVANHQSVVDIPLLLSAFRRPVKFLAKRELGEIPLFGKAMAAAGNLFVDREDPRDAVQMLREAAARVRCGGLIAVFPEGTRSADGSIGEFKPGAFYLAQRSGAPVVPVYIDGGNRALPKGTFRFRPADLLVRVLPPLTAAEGAGGAKERISASVRERIVQERNRVKFPTGEGTPPEGDISGVSPGRREGVSPPGGEGMPSANREGASSAR
jgi:1-acyl-sn-glycerol-3-phosphate acyltransferase